MTVNQGNKGSQAWPVSINSGSVSVVALPDITASVTLSGHASVTITTNSYPTILYTNINGAGFLNIFDNADMGQNNLPFYFINQPLHSDVTLFLTQSTINTQINSTYTAAYNSLNGIKNLTINNGSASAITFTYALKSQPLVNTTQPGIVQLQDWLEGNTNASTSKYPVVIAANASPTAQIEVDNPVLRNDISIRQTATQTPVSVSPISTWPVGFRATPEVQAAIVDAQNNSNFANCVSITTNGIVGAQGVVSAAVLYAVTGTNSITRASFGNDNLGTQGPNNANITTRSISEGYIWGNQNAYERWNGIDAISNTNTALGVASVGLPSYLQSPTTYTTTGSVTYGPFTPFCTSGSIQITTTGTITAASVSVYGSNDNVNFAALGSTQFTLTTFSGTDMLTWSNLPAVYIKPIVTIGTLGGTNIIITPCLGHL